MVQRAYVYGVVTLLLWLLLACTPNNVALGPNELDPAQAQGPNLELEVAREPVFVVQEGGQSQLLPLSELVPITIGQEAGVDEEGRAIVHVDDILTLELLQGSTLEIQQVARADNATVINLRQDGGVLVADLTRQPDTNQRLTVQTEAGIITAIGGRFVVVHEAALTWVLALAAAQNEIQVTAGGETAPIVGGQARWLAVAGTPSPTVSVSRGVEAWLNGARNNAEQPALSEILLPPVNMLADASELTMLPAPGESAKYAGDVQGVVNFTLDAKGIFGRPAYTLADCNGDNVPDIAIQNGILTLDFRQLLARVQAIDMTILNRDRPGNGLLEGLSPASETLGEQQLQAASEQLQTLSLRADQPYHYARLVVNNACLVGLKLLPPGTASEPEPAQVETTTQLTSQGDSVVNVLAASAERLPQNGQFQAPNVGGGLTQIDGQPDDWDSLAEQSGSGWTDISAITYDETCAARYPDSGDLTDLAGRMQLAYDAENLYVAFVVNDDGLVTYSGPDERYFLGDSLQLLLDLDLNGDFDTAQLNSDDIQIDFLPSADNPAAALWRLSTLTAAPLVDASIAVTPTDTGYFFEAAIPWLALNTNPQPGDRLGIVASINDNDTPETNAQQCIISTSPQRDWRNPVTWGTVLLMPVSDN